MISCMFSKSLLVQDAIDNQLMQRIYAIRDCLQFTVDCASLRPYGCHLIDVKRVDFNKLNEWN